MQHLAILGQEIPEEQLFVAIVSGLRDQYDMRRHILDSESRLTRSLIETVTQQRFERLEAEKERSGAVVLAAPTTSRDKDSISVVAKCARNQHT